MFRKTDAQKSLLESHYLLSPKKAERLKRSWAHAFRMTVLPLIDENIFRDAYSAQMGRPNFSIKVLVGLHLLKEWHDLTDRQVLEQLEYNLQWHYALAVEPSDAHTCQKTLHNFRVIAGRDDRVTRMFEEITRALAEADGISVDMQRLDSTHIMSNIAQLTRLTLFVETISKFLRTLRRELPDRIDQLGPALIERYLDREGYFNDATKEQARRRLPVVARDLSDIICLFEEDSAASALPSYALLERLFDDQCEFVEDEDEDDGDDDDDDDDDEGDDAVSPVALAQPRRKTQKKRSLARKAGRRGRNRQGRVELRAPKTIASTSLQSPHDPDATYGHKGKGYELQIAETCDPDNPYQLVTRVALNAAHESDQNALIPVLDALSESAMAAREVLVDMGYSSGKNIVAAAQRDVSLLAPVRDPTRGEVRTDAFAASSEVRSTPIGSGEGECDEDLLEWGEFGFSTRFDEVKSCPAGHEPAEQMLHESNRGAMLRATFNGCDECGLRGVCPTREIGDGVRVLARSPASLAMATRQVVQQTSEFKERYRLRSGVESANHELKGKHGAGNLRVRRRGRVHMVCTLKTLAMNVKRAVMHQAKVWAGETKARLGVDPALCT